jgi:hypothetical protein
VRGEPFRGSFFKQPQLNKVAKVKAQRQRKSKEADHMQRARRRDGYCRFPNCKCRDFRLALEVSHAVKHRGMGGNPAGDRTEPKKLILLCVARHQRNVVSIDRHSLRVRALDARQGLGGPCAFDVDLRVLFDGAWQQARRPKWFEVGRETARHIFEPFTPEQQGILDKLKGMEL